MPVPSRPRGEHGLGQQGPRTGAGEDLRILFSALHFAYFRNFESAIQELARRGHDVHLLADEPETLGGEALARRLSAESPRVRWSFAPPVVEEPWFPVARKLRHALEYVRFLDPRFDGSPKLRIRSEERAPRVTRWFGRSGLRRTPMRRVMAAILMRLERLMPLSEADTTFLRDEAPDALLLTSMTYPRAPQLDHQKAALRLGIRVGACIMSWDHLSSKSPLHLVPDRLFVWNELQRAEAVDLHPIPSARVVVTGAQCYDQWFERRPDRTREEFCGALGLDADRPIVMYVGSTMHPSPDPPEHVFTRRWLEALRESPDPRLRAASVIVRPHPERLREWQAFDTSELGPVVVHGRNPIDAEAKSDYFDSLYHSAAVAGICTTAFIEAAIIGRPVFAFLHEPFRIHQETMVHFNYLVNVEGGVLQTADTFAAHFEQIARDLATSGARNARNAAFLRAFIRPHGLEEAATPRFVSAIERFVEAPPDPAPDPPRWYDRALAPVARHLTASGERGATAWLLMDAIESRRAAFERRQRRDKERQKRIRARNPRKQIAWVKTVIKRSLGLPLHGK